MKEIHKKHEVFGDCTVTEFNNFYTITFKDKPKINLDNVRVWYFDCYSTPEIQSDRIGNGWCKRYLKSEDFNGMQPHMVVDFINDGKISGLTIKRLEEIFTTNILEDNLNTMSDMVKEVQSDYKYNVKIEKTEEKKLTEMIESF